MSLPKGIGRLWDRGLLQSPIQGSNPFGEAPVTGWNDEQEVWVSIDPQGGRELIQAQQIQPDTAHVLIIRFRPGVKANWRMLFGTRALNFLSVTNFEERDEYLKITTAEYQE